MNIGVLCPKCGLMQMNRPACKSCGAPLSDSALMPSSSFAPSTPQEIRYAPDPPSPHSLPLKGGAENAAAARLSFHGKGRELFGIYLINIFLSLVTLGIYYFWGKVKIRNYLFSHTEFWQERFVYHGTGKELLVGFLKALVLFFIPLYALNAAPALLETGLVFQAVATGLTYGIVMVFVPLAMVGARRYRLSRTSWRGIRFSFRGQAWDFIKIFGLGSILSTITLGLYFPFFDAKRYDFMVSHSYFGNQKFSFDGLRKRSLPALPFCHFPDPSHFGSLLVLVLGQEAALLLGAHFLRIRPLSFHGNRPGAYEPASRELPHRARHPRIGMAVDPYPQDPVCM